MWLGIRYTGCLHFPFMYSLYLLYSLPSNSCCSHVFLPLSFISIAMLIWLRLSTVYDVSACFSVHGGKEHVCLYSSNFYRIWDNWLINCFLILNILIFIVLLILKALLKKMLTLHINWIICLWFTLGNIASVKKCSSLYILLTNIMCIVLKLDK